MPNRSGALRLRVLRWSQQMISRSVALSGPLRSRALTAGCCAEGRRVVVGIGAQKNARRRTARAATRRSSRIDGMAITPFLYFLTPDDRVDQL